MLHAPSEPAVIKSNKDLESAILNYSGSIDQISEYIQTHSFCLSCNYTELSLSLPMLCAKHLPEQELLGILNWIKSNGKLRLEK